MRRILFILITMLFVTTAYSQRNGSIAGSISDINHQNAIPFVNVTLQQNGEETAFGTVTDDSGNFSLEKVSLGTYTVVASFIGYETKTISNVTLTKDKPSVDLGSIGLSISAISLDKVNVSAEANTATTKIDRQTYRVSDFATAQGGSAVDVLNKLPSVSVSSEGNVSVRGTTDFMVYLNGKPTQMDQSMLLSQLSSDGIESIDVITVPTAKYDAQGKGGIINITTKKSSQDGLSISGGGMIGGTPWTNSTDVYSNHELNNNRYNADLSLFYNKNKLSLNGAVYYKSKHNKGIGDIYTYIHQDNTQANSNSYYILDGMGARPKWSSTFLTSFGLGYELSENSNLAATYQYSQRETGRAAHYKYNTFFANTPYGTPITGTEVELYNPNDINRTGTFSNLTLDYNLNIDESSAFTSSFVYEVSDLKQVIDNKEFNYDSERYYFNDTPNFHSLQSDETPLSAYRLAFNYDKKLDNGSTISTGVQSQWIRLDGMYEYDTINTNTNNFAGYDHFNNSIDLSRDVYAAYIDYSGKTGDVTYVLGVRFEYLDQQMNVENTDYFSDVYGVFGPGRELTEKAFEADKFDVFPTAHLKYSINDKNSVALASSYRVNRPPAKDMAPFLYRRHQEIFEMGDPMLEPEYIVNAEMTYLHSFGKNNVQLTGFYRGVDNAIYRVNRVSYMDNEGGLLLRSYTNSGNQKAMGGELGININSIKKLKLYAGGSLYDFKVEADESLFGDQKNSQSINWSFKTNVGWTIVDPLKLTFDYSITSGSVTPQGESKEFQMLNVSLNYSPKKLSGWNFSAKMLDIMGTNQAGGYTNAYNGNLEIFNRDYVYDYEGQIVEISATYTINMKGKKAKSKDIIGNDYF